jgi:ATP-dependent RNA helicase RhlE
MRQGADIVVATPGRLLDLANQGAVSLAEVGIFVLDEADRMLDMGFIHDIKRIRALLPKQRQNLLFSATYSSDIRKLAENLLRDPLAIEVTPPNRTADKVEQVSYRLPKDHKRHLLAHLINDGNWHQVLVFTRTKHGANRLADQLTRAGIPSAPIHGNKSQNARVRALDDFKSNKIVALVATEVAARGIDIKELPYVVNYELPNVPEDYVHRIGRTARAGSTGKAVSLVSPDEAPFLKDIIKLLGRDIPTQPLPAFAMTEPPPGAQSSQPERQPQHRPQQNQPRRGGGGGASNPDARRQQGARQAHGQRPGSGGGQQSSQRRGQGGGQGGGQRSGGGRPR